MVNEEVYKTVKVNNFDVIDQPENPEIMGYIFVGWYHGDVKFDFSCEIATDITLTAKFIENNDDPNDPVCYQIIFIPISRSVTNHHILSTIEFDSIC